MRNLVQSELSRETAEKLYRYLIGRPLLRVEADALQVIAEYLGKEIRWQHLDLLPGLQWESGRYENRRQS